MSCREDQEGKKPSNGGGPTQTNGLDSVLFMGACVVPFIPPKGGTLHRSTLRNSAEEPQKLDGVHRLAGKRGVRHQHNTIMVQRSKTVPTVVRVCLP